MQTTSLNSSYKRTGTRWYESLPSYLYQYYLVFDTETTTDETQALKFGVYELHGLSQDVLTNALVRNTSLTPDFCDMQISSGVFYNPDVLSTSDVALIQVYAKQHSLFCLTLDQFIELFYHYAHSDAYTLVIGHNLAFDISRLSREVQYAKGSFENGFSLKLCSCAWKRTKGKTRGKGDSCRHHPNIRIKKIAPKIHLYEFCDRKPKGNFLDTQTFARALLGPGSTSLESLGKILGIESQKYTENIEHGTALSQTYLDYAVRDVTATWEIFQKLRDIYKTYNFTQKMQYIFSEASLGKSLYKELGITPVMSRMKNIPPEIHGYAMTTYYGGRSEVHIRKKPVEIAYCDFKSEYPTVFSLMGLQEMLLAQEYMFIDVSDVVRDILASFMLEDLQHPLYWHNLRKLCKISGDNLILPVRAHYNEQSSNIALCNVSLQEPVWYTLSDVLAGMLLGGSTPRIEQAIEVVPIGQIETQPLDMFDGLVKINPSQEDIFVTLINERTRIKKLAKQEPENKERLSRVQQALKLLANSTSYGINIELRTESSEEPIMLYGNDQAMLAASSIAQIPGSFYCPLIGTHIPSGGRLLLALAQRLGRDRGLTYAFCDTDSMAFVKPSDMPCSVFYGHVVSIMKWFMPLYPYSDQGELFELEDVNIWQGKLEPLFCLGISAKRYVLYNKLDSGYRIRKVSAHGLGAYSVSEHYKSYAPVSDVPLSELGLSNYQQWIHDIWYAAIVLSERGIGGTPDTRALNTPVYHQVTLSTAHLYKLFAHIPGIKPFNFVTVFPGFTKQALQQRLKDHPELKEAYEKITSSLYVPFTRDVEKITTFHVLEKNEAVHHIKPLTISEALADYFSHVEYKSENGRFTGEMRMRNITITGYQPQGKESSYEVVDLEDNDLPIGLSQEAINLEYMTLEKWHDLQERIRSYGVNALARALNIPSTSFSRMLAKRVPPDQALVKRIKKVLG